MHKFLTGFLKQQLDDYVLTSLPKTKVVRAEKREGLIRARLLGARAANGDVLIFLDSHSEANVNWLPPLLGIIDCQCNVFSIMKIIFFSHFRTNC